MLLVLRNKVALISGKNIRRINTILPKTSVSPKNYQGPNYNEIKRIRNENIAPCIKTYYKKPLLLHHGKMQWLFDHEGNRYLDMFGGIVTVSVGHCHPKVNEALKSQIDTLWHTTNIYLHPKLHEYAEALTKKFPKDLKVVYFVNSGSEANDLALLLSRLYTGNTDIITLQNSYHGGVGLTVGLTGLGIYKYKIPPPQGIYQTMNPNPYSGIWGGKNCRDSPIQVARECECSLEECDAANKYLEQLRNTIEYSTSRKLAGFFAEPIQGVGGSVQYPKGYLKKAYDLIREFGGLCIADEVQTGFGRTGDDFWGFESHGVVPDIVTMAKGIGNGFPLGAVVTTEKIARSLENAMHFNTFGGNPMACTAGLAVLNVIEEEKLQENSKIVGTYLLKKLETLREEFSCVGDVRGKGLLIGIELVENKENCTPLKPSIVADIWEECKERRLLIGKGGLHSNVFRLKPPMCVTKEDADFAYNVLYESIKKYDNQKHN